MSKTNQVCISCPQMDSCPHYDTRRTNCVPVNVSDYGQFTDALQESTDWQQVRIQAAIAAMQAVLTNYEYYAEGIKTECENSNTTRPKVVAFMARELANALVAELKKGGQDETVK